MTRTQCIILVKRPYKESALLLSTLSPDFGKLDLVLHQGQKLGAKNFPAADLFRELEVEFEESVESTLHTAKNVELLTEFDALADNAAAFALADRMAGFLLRNAQPDLPMPYTYDTFRTILAQLSRPAADDGTGFPRWTLEQASVVLKTAYLEENGLLPEARDEQQQTFLESLVEAGIENSPLPPCPEPYWKQLNTWLNALLLYHKLK